MDQVQYKGSKKKHEKPKVKLYNRNKSGSLKKEQEEISNLLIQYKKAVSSDIKVFSDFPLSKKTHKGLKEAGYDIPTEIQKESILLSLKGSDILGSAKTGSGKTLAFIIPILEKLYCNSWCSYDGLGALVITPTRELAYQIFEVLKSVGKFHHFSAGLIIGGKDLKFESSRLENCNIVIGTPGRILQHMDENPVFSCSSLQILVLDEADRILDLGFSVSMNAIIDNLPKSRQTLLFSATQTKSVKDLGRLSLTTPIYVSVHEHAKFSTPETLVQSYVVCGLEHKVDFLWSFIKNHLHQKILVFFSTCKQVKFIYDAFCSLRPGMSILGLYGTLHQMRRMAIYDEFCSKSSVVMFATDIAARGLDFPEVKWVVQMDCPDDVNTYIHRVGRTARYQTGGEAILVLLHNEEKAMVKYLEDKKVPISKIGVNPSKFVSVQRKLSALLARNVELKLTAQRACVSYMKSTFLMKDKNLFDVTNVNVEELSKSYGLAIPPRVRFLNKKQKQVNSKDESNFNPQLSQAENLSGKFSFDVEDDDDLLILKSKYVPDSDLSDQKEIVASKKLNKRCTKIDVAKKILRKKLVVNSKMVFDDAGEPILNPNHTIMSEAAKSYNSEELGGIDIEQSKAILRAEDKHDRELFRKRVREKHKNERVKGKVKSTESNEMVCSGDENEGAGKFDECELGTYSSDEYEVHSPEVKNESSESEYDSDDKPASVKRPKVEYLSKGMSLGEEESLVLQLLRQK